jgi:hypothetical protein
MFYRWTTEHAAALNQDMSCAGPAQEAHFVREHRAGRTCEPDRLTWQSRDHNVLGDICLPLLPAATSEKKEVHVGSSYIRQLSFTGRTVATRSNE